ncbi:hypothetical protein M2275_003058 [Rhodococcus opacus]|nr:hypothetical protein [Rhodococcus opacus]
MDVEDTDTADAFELPGRDLSGEELIVRVIPKQADEFTCTSYFLVHHRSRLANGTQLICGTAPENTVHPRAASSSPRNISHPS